MTELTVGGEPHFGPCIDTVRAERGRLALLRGIDALERSIDSYELKRSLGQDTLSPREQTLIAELRHLLTETHMAHKKVWE